MATSGELIQIEIGARETWTINWGMDITGYTTFIAIKRKTTDDDADAVWSAEITTHNDEINGVDVVDQPASNTINLKGFYYWSTRLYDDSGDVMISMKGQLEYTTNVIKAITTDELP